MTRTRTIAAVLASLPLAALLTIVCVSATWSQTVTIPARVGKVEIPAQTIELPPQPLPDRGLTAEDLSKPGALQAFVDMAIDSGEIAQLPGGKIVVDPSPLMLTKDSTILRGVGANYGDRITGTVLVAKDPTRPIIAVRNALGVKIEDLGMLGTPESVCGVSLEGSNGALVFHTAIRDAALCRFKVGIRVSEPPGTRPGQNAAADTVIDHVRFTLCERPVETNHPQAVNTHLTGQCYFYACGTNQVNAGGRFLIRDAGANPIATVLTLASGGGNEMPSIIENFYADRTGRAPKPVAIDARGVQGQLIAVVRDYSMSTQADVDGKWSEIKHDNFIAPTGEWARANAVWDINAATFNAPGSKAPK